jgi:CHASE2 domain-containing sensor protein
MRDRVYTASILNTACLGFAFIMTIYAFPLRLQVVNGRGALLAGVMLLPLLGASAVGSMLAGAINSKQDWVCETLVASSGLMALGSGLMSTQSSSANVEPKALGFLVFLGLGFGLSAASSTMLAHMRVSAEDQGA